MKRLISSISAAASALAISALAATHASAEDYYAGKTITVVVPFSQGGATYVSAKFLEPFLEKHIPGNPDIEVVDL